MFIISFVYIIFLGCFFSDQAKFEFQHIIIDFSDMEIVASISAVAMSVTPVGPGSPGEKAYASASRQRSLTEMLGGIIFLTTETTT